MPPGLSGRQVVRKIPSTCAAPKCEFCQVQRYISSFVRAPRHVHGIAREVMRRHEAPENPDRGLEHRRVMVSAQRSLHEAFSVSQGMRCVQGCAQYSNAHIRKSSTSATQSRAFWYSAFMPMSHIVSSESTICEQAGQRHGGQVRRNTLDDASRHKAIARHHTVAPSPPKPSLPVFAMGSSSSWPQAYVTYEPHACFIAATTFSCLLA